MRKVRPGRWPRRFRKAYEGFNDSLDDIRHLSAAQVTNEPLTREALNNHREFLTEVNRRVDAQGLTMERVMKDSQGRWDTDFYTWMLDTVDEIYEAKGYADRPKEGKALVTGGLGGAGKTTTLKKLGASKTVDTGNWITINPDDMKEEMAARGIFPVIEGMSTAEMAHIMHGVSSELAHLMGQRAMSDGHNVIFDVTMGGGPAKNPDGTWGSRGAMVIQDINSFPGYEIDGLFMDITADQSVSNALNRHEQGLLDLRAGRSAEGGRYVAPEIIKGNEYVPGPGERGQPNPIGYELSKWEDGSKIVTPYEDRYGTDKIQVGMAASAEEVRAAIFSADKDSAALVDDLLAKHATLNEIMKGALPDRAREELKILQDEWAFLDPRTSGEDPATRFHSVNAYNFAKAVHGGGFADYAIFDNSDLDHQVTVESTGKYEGITLPEGGGPRRDHTGPMTEGLSGTGESTNVQDVMTGLEDGTHELASVPTSDAGGKFRLHVPMLHSDESEMSQWLEYDTAEARDAALEQARKLQEESFARRAERISALSAPLEEAKTLANGLVDMPETDGTGMGNIRARFAAQKRLRPVKLPSGEWGLQDAQTGTMVGAPGDRRAIASRRDQILNQLYPRLG